MAMQRHHSRKAVPAFGASFWTGLAEEVLITLAHSVVLFTGLGITLYALDPSRTSKSAADKHRKSVSKKMRDNGRVPFEMNDYEAIVALDLVYPNAIRTGFSDIGGLEKKKKEIENLVCLPLKRLDLFSGKSDLIRPPKGILLFGPPGTGKTMIAKAIAKESGAAFINLKVSTLMDKWFGESEKLVRATFTLAWKLSPCIIFIDELESFLKKRGQSVEHQAVSNMKAEFMSLWDGLNANLFLQPKEEKSTFQKVISYLPFMGNKSNRAKNQEDEVIAARKKMFGVVVIGATNRPGDIDEAVLRRMARTFLLDLPDEKQRLAILKIILKNEEISSNLASNLPVLAKSLEGFSGSDLKELCRAAAVIPLRELAQAQNAKITSIRKLQISDFLEAKKKVYATGFAAKQYQNQLNQRETNEGSLGGFNPQVLASFAAAFAAMNNQRPE